MVLRPETEHRRRTVERLGEVRQRRDADAAADEQRPRDVEPEAVAERPEHVQLLARLERGERLRARPDRIEQEPELAPRREAERHRPRQRPARRLEHEELAGPARVGAAALDTEERVRPDRLDGDDPTTLARVGLDIDPLLQRQRGVRAGVRDRRVAADAAAIVVMHGTRATSAASRIRYPSRATPRRRPAC